VYLIYTYTCAGRQTHGNTTRKYNTTTNSQNDGGLLGNAAESIFFDDNNNNNTQSFFFIVCSFCLNPFYPCLFSESIFPRYMFIRHSREKK